MVTEYVFGLQILREARDPEDSEKGVTTTKSPRVTCRHPKTHAPARREVRG